MTRTHTYIQIMHTCVRGDTSMWEDAYVPEEGVKVEDIDVYAKYIAVYERTATGMYVSQYVCVFVYMSVCMYVCMYAFVCMHVCV